MRFSIAPHQFVISSCQQASKRQDESLWLTVVVVVMQSIPACVVVVCSHRRRRRWPFDVIELFCSNLPLCPVLSFALFRDGYPSSSHCLSLSPFFLFILYTLRNGWSSLIWFNAHNNNDDDDDECARQHHTHIVGHGPLIECKFSGVPVPLPPLQLQHRVAP